MNHYVRLNHVKADGGIVGSSQDAALLRLIERVSRAFDDLTSRRFYSQVGTRRYDGNGGPVIAIDDLVSATSVTDDGTTLTADTDYWLGPDNRGTHEPARLLELNPDSATRTLFTPGRRKVAITGLWGYSHETEASGLTGTLSNGADVTLTTDEAAEGVIYPGDTLVMGGEQLYVAEVAYTTVRVARGINGTTAVAQSTAPVSLRRYPRALEEAALLQVMRLWRMQQTGGADAFGGDTGMNFSTLYPVIRDLLMPLSVDPVVAL